ncbi:phosphoribosylaminoimidazole synthetase [Hazenella sp. IB182353]|uniref:phosphoribosylaminoimidazole synthetase n=1 Tax=Polycladospora coralii TaxID=2771432 RepID=UPI00174707D2|nr:phosphoribosylaminoimidazole synthetase [Polycladospora coralii]MBS7529426.1 phosphoribosylaminoimidazole synthetase [Polycladospora coralii]
MKVKCIKNKRYMFPRESVMQGNTLTTTFKGLCIDDVYNVYGMCLSGGEIKYLLHDEYGYAKWYYADLFELIDHRLPSDWYHTFLGYRENSVSNVWGYKELIMHTNHFDDLVDLKEEALEIFHLRKKQMDHMYDR